MIYCVGLVVLENAEGGLKKRYLVHKTAVRDGPGCFYDVPAVEATFTVMLHCSLSQKSREAY